ncbi:MAG TPA: PAS domain-containing protein [Stellaceae bacterium]|nr:PAS domain-containing protein [Stellaceae bacterium]
MPPIIADNRVLAGLWTYWQAKRGTRSMPRRRDIDPAEIVAILPYLQLVERMDGRFRYRLCGTAIVEAYGHELTSRFVDEIIPAHRRVVAEHHYTLSYEGRRPIFFQNKYTTTRSLNIIASRLILPLSEDDSTVAMLLMAQTFDYGAEMPTRLDMEATIAPYFDRVEFL